MIEPTEGSARGRGSQSSKGRGARPCPSPRQPGTCVPGIRGMLVTVAGGRYSRHQIGPPGRRRVWPTKTSREN